MLRKLFLFTVIGMLFVMVQAGGANADIVANGGFTTLDFSGWTLGGDTANPFACYYVNQDGSLPNPNYAQFGTDGSAITLSQTLAAAIPGQTYSVTLLLKNDLPAEPSWFQAFWNGTSKIYLTTGGMSCEWTPYSFTAAALGNDVLTFSFRHDTAMLNITNVSANAVPIPAALFLFGPGVAALVLLRKRFIG